MMRQTGTGAKDPLKPAGARCGHILLPGMTRWIAPLALALMLGGQTGTPQTDSSLDVRARPFLNPVPGTVHVIVFVGVECPISNRYAPELGRIARDYAGKGVRVFLAFADPELDTSRVQKHTAEFYSDLSSPPYLDRDRSLARAVGAKATPTAAIYTAAGRQYRGRIDDLYISLTQARREPTERTLRLSLDAVLAGRPVPKPETPAIGCSIGGYP